MSKRLNIFVIIVLLVAVTVISIFLGRQSGNLGGARAEIIALQNKISSLEDKVSAAEADSQTLKVQIAESEAKVLVLQADLDGANADLDGANTNIVGLEKNLKIQQDQNLSLSEQLQKVMYPHHFESLAELTTWIQQDDTHTKYADVNPLQRALILQVRAQWDGYLMPVRIGNGSQTQYIVNTTVIGDTLWTVRASDHFLDRGGEIIPPVATELPIE